MSSLPISSASLLPLQPARVSLLSQADSAQQSINTTQTQLAQVENEISTGKQVNVPSDNPSAAAVIQQLQQTLGTQTAYSDNLNQASSQLSEASSTLGSLNSLLLQAQNIASANVGTDATPSQRQAAAAVVASLYQQAITIGNTQFEGAYLFGGDNASQAPFVSGTTGLVYNGSPTTLENTVAADTNLSFQVDGNAVFGALSTQVQGTANLEPAATTQTRLVDIGGATGSGVSPGTIRIGDGTTSVAVDLSKASSLGDVVNAINASGLADVTASLSGSSIQLSAAGGANISVNDVGGGSTARDLGILTPTGGGAGASITGQNLNVKISDITPLSALNGGAGIDTSGLTITNGQTTAHISFASATNVQDMLNAINGSSLGVRASINAAGTGINIVNSVQGSAMTIAENGGTTAAELGVRSFGPSTPLSQLNGGKGVGTAANGASDFQIQDSAGNTFSVTVGSAATVQDVLNEINAASSAAGAGVTASFATAGNGIVLTDNSGGGGTLTVTGLNSSTAAHDLGLTTTAVGNVINGTDVNPVSPQGIFADLSALQNALNNNDSAGITTAAQGLQSDYNRVSVISGQAGAQAQEVAGLQTQLQNQGLATQTLLSSLQDTNMATAITTFQSLQTSLQAELATQARSLSLNLLDFLQ